MTWYPRQPLPTSANNGGGIYREREPVTTSLASKFIHDLYHVIIYYLYYY